VWAGTAPPDGRGQCSANEHEERGDLKERREGLLNSITVKNEVVARRYFVSGRVQGVGYRNYVEHVAEKLGLSGYVKNRRDGTVEVFAMGTPEQLGALRAALQKGPMMARVADVMEEPSAVEPKYQGQFAIEFTD
jgi:acylphosphatase